MSAKSILNDDGLIPKNMIDSTLINDLSLVQSKVENLESNVGNITTENYSQIQQDILSIKSTLDDIKEKVYALYLSVFNPDLE